ncbi:hypothetical protein H9P43_000427 [Blastocladiella emersonii ATCC 22665]|nr:hypothetical protein H9P43_000427 [Blastocladiella emersonii ATCC 22665]
MDNESIPPSDMTPPRSQTRRRGVTLDADLEPLSPPRPNATTPPGRPLAAVDPFATPARRTPASFPHSRAATHTPGGTRVRIAKSRLRELPPAEVALRRQARLSTTSSDLSAPTSPPTAPATDRSASWVAARARARERIRLLNSPLRENDDDADSISVASSTDADLTSFTSLLVDDMDGVDSPDQLDLEEYALIEALNGVHGLELETMGLLVRNRGNLGPRTASTLPSDASKDAAAAARPQGPSRIPRPKPAAAALSASQDSPLKPSSSAAPPPPSASDPPGAASAPLVSPLEVMDAAHLAHLAKVHGLSVKVNSVHIATAALVRLRKDAGMGSVLPGPTSSAALAESIQVQLGLDMPGDLGERTFSLDVRNSTLMRAQRRASVAKDGALVDDEPAAGSADGAALALGVPSLAVPWNKFDALPVHFNARVVQVFMQSTVSLRLALCAKPTRTFGRGMARLATRPDPVVEMVGEGSVRLVDIMRADRFAATAEVPFFAEDTQFLGTVQIAFALLPSFSPSAKGADPPEGSHTALVTPAPSPRPTLPEPPFPVQLVLDLGVFTALAVPVSSYKTYPADRHSHNMQVQIVQRLGLVVRGHVPLETTPIPWVHRRVDQTAGLVMDQVQVQAQVRPIDFGAHFAVPTSVNLLAPWLDAPLVVEVWSHTSRTTWHHVLDQKPAATRDQPLRADTFLEPPEALDSSSDPSTARELLGIVKVPLHQLLQTLVRTSASLGWTQLIPLALTDVDCPVVDPLTGDSRGWLTASVGIEPRNAAAAPPPPEPARTETAATPAPARSPPRPVAHAAAPSAELLVAVHEAGGMWSLAEHVARELLAASGQAMRPPQPLNDSAPFDWPRSTATQLSPPTALPTDLDAALRHLLDSRSLNLYVEIKLFPRSIARAVGCDAAPLRTKVAWDTAVPSWTDGGAGLVVPLQNLDDHFLRWMESAKAVAHGRVWHQFAGSDEDENDGAVQGRMRIPDLLVGEFRIELARLVKRSTGLRDTWAAVHVPAVLGPEHGITGFGSGIAIPRAPTHGHVHLDMCFTDTVAQPLAPFAPVSIEIELLADVRSEATGALIGRSFQVSLDAGTLLGDQSSDDVTAAPAPLVWNGTMAVDAAALQESLNGKLRFRIDESNHADADGGEGVQPVGLAVVDTFSLAHALLRLVNRRQGTERCPFRVPVLTPESPVGSNLVVSGSVVARVAAVEQDVSAPVPSAAFAASIAAPGPFAVSVTARDSPAEPFRGVQLPQHAAAAALAPEQQPVRPTIRIQAAIVAACGFSLLRHGGALSTTVLASFVWSTDEHLVHPFASSVMTMASGDGNGLDKRTFTTPCAEPDLHDAAGSAADATWNAAFEVAQSVEPAALRRLQRKKVVVVKLWETVQRPEQSVRGPAALPGSDDRLIAFAKVDISPLVNGLGEIDGWYNLTDYRGQTCGQVHVRFSPRDPVPDAASLTPSPAATPPLRDFARTCDHGSVARGASSYGHGRSVSASEPSPPSTMSSSTSLSLDLLTADPPSVEEYEYQRDVAAANEIDLTLAHADLSSSTSSAATARRDSVDEDTASEGTLYRPLTAPDSIPVSARPPARAFVSVPGLREQVDKLNREIVQTMRSHKITPLDHYQP